jgi:hypothetical protein
MTQMYMDHAADIDKKEHLSRMPNLLNPKKANIDAKSDSEKLQAIRATLEQQKDCELKRQLEAVLLG